MKTNERLYIDFHVLQTVPPSCVNRDDTGAPKTAVYGGATRARVSSQAWKRAIRMMFTERLPEEQVGKRTKNVLGLLAETIAARDASVNAEKLALPAKEKMRTRRARFSSLAGPSWTRWPGLRLRAKRTRKS